MATKTRNPKIKGGRARFRKTQSLPKSKGAKENFEKFNTK